MESQETLPRALFFLAPPRLRRSAKVQVAHGPGRLGRQGRNDLQRGLLLGWLGLHCQAVEEGGQQHLHREGGDHALRWCPCYGSVEVT